MLETDLPFATTDPPAGEPLELIEPYLDEGERDLESLVAVFRGAGRHVTPELLAMSDIGFREVAPGETCPCGSERRFKRCCGRRR
jgi:uncharacterized protein YecA (UPF0149 family)